MIKDTATTTAIVTTATYVVVHLVKEFWKYLTNSKEDSKVLNKDYRKDLQKQIDDLKNTVSSLIRKLENSNKEALERERALLKMLTNSKALARRLLTVCEVSGIDVEESKKEYNELDKDEKI